MPPASPSPMPAASGLSPARRQILGAAAWSAPVVAVAASAPALAASSASDLALYQAGGDAWTLENADGSQQLRLTQPSVIGLANLASGNIPASAVTITATADARFFSGFEPRFGVVASGPATVAGNVLTQTFTPTQDVLEATDPGLPYRTQINLPPIRIEDLPAFDSFPTDIQPVSYAGAAAGDTNPGNNSVVGSVEITP